MRKAGEPITGDTQRPKGTAMAFDIAEHEKVNELLKEFTMPLDLYCFFRKNLPGQLAPERIAAIMDEYYQCRRFEVDNAGVEESLQSPFIEFQKNFFAGTFEIVDSTAVAA